MADITDIHGRLAELSALQAADDIAPVTLTAEDASVVDATYGTQEAAVINNLRTRLGEIEAQLQAAGLLN